MELLGRQQMDISERQISCSRVACDLHLLLPEHHPTDREPCQPWCLVAVMSLAGESSQLWTRHVLARDAMRDLGLG